MASKNKILVHIGDDIVYETILSEAKNETKTKSEYVRDKLEMLLENKICEKRFSFHDKYSYNRFTDAASVFPLNITVDSTRHFDGGFLVHLDRIDKVLSFNFESEIFGMMSFTSNQLKQTAKSEALRLLPKLIKDTWSDLESEYSRTDINLVFINRVDVKFEGYLSDRFIINIKIHFNVSRFPLGSISSNKDFLRIDFLNIHYLRFKDVAINGRLYKKYERLLYLKPIKESLLGGFFSGLFYNPRNKDELLDEINDLIENSNSTHEGMLSIPGRFVKIHCNTEQVKVDGRSFNKAYKMILEQRKEINEKKNPLQK